MGMAGDGDGWGGDLDCPDPALDCWIRLVAGGSAAKTVALVAKALPAAATRPYAASIEL